jgi:hypothetical protein
MWNPNCKNFHYFLLFNQLIVHYLAYDIINGSVELIYRVEQFYGFGYLLRRSFYEKYMKDSFKECCSKRFEENSLVIEFGFVFL